MSDFSQGQGWWLASDGKWYPPEAEPGYQQPIAPPVAPPNAPPVPSQPKQPLAGSNGCMKWALGLVALCLLLGVGAVACIAIVADDVAVEIENGFAELEESVEEGLAEVEEAAQEPVDDTAAEPDITDDAPSVEPDPPSDETPDAVGCRRVDADNIELQVVNNSSKTSTYWITVAFLDDDGNRLGNETSFINYLRAGERTIETSFVFESAGENCEIIDVDRSAAESDPEHLAEVSDCTVSGSDTFGDVAASVVVTNGSSKNSDYFVDVAFIDADGVRRGTGSTSIEVVRAGESAPGDLFTSIDFTDGMTCEVVHVNRTFAAGSEDAGTAEDGTRSGEAADVVGCTRLPDELIQLEVVNNSSKTSNYWINIGYFGDDGTRLGDELTFVTDLRPGERTIENSFTFNASGTTCEVLDVERSAADIDESLVADAGPCEALGEDFVGQVEATVSVTNSSSENSDYSITVAIVDSEGVRRGTGTAFVEVVRPGETAPTGIFSSVDYDAGFSCEVVNIARSSS